MTIQKPSSTSRHRFPPWRNIQSGLSSSLMRRNSKRKEREEMQMLKTQVLAIPCDTRGRPPIRLELDSKLISLLQSIRSRYGVINYSVVKATALALDNSNPMTNLTGFEAKVPWAKSIYWRFTSHAELELPRCHQCLKECSRSASSLSLPTSTQQSLNIALDYDTTLTQITWF